MSNGTQQISTTQDSSLLTEAANLTQDSLASTFLYNLSFLVLGVIIEFVPPLWRHAFSRRYLSRRKLLKPTDEHVDASRRGSLWFDLVRDSLTAARVRNLMKQRSLKNEIELRRLQRASSLHQSMLSRGPSRESMESTKSERLIGTSYGHQDTSQSGNKSTRESGESVAVGLVAGRSESENNEGSDSSHLLGLQWKSEASDDSEEESCLKLQQERHVKFASMPSWGPSWKRKASDVAQNEKTRKEQRVVFNSQLSEEVTGTLVGYDELSDAYSPSKGKGLDLDAFPIANTDSLADEHLRPRAKSSPVHTKSDRSFDWQPRTDVMEEEETFAESLSRKEIHAMKSQAAAHTSYTNYLCFLKVCRAMFLTMSCVTMLCMLPHVNKWSLHPLIAGIAGGRLSLVNDRSDVDDESGCDMDQLGLVLLYFQTMCNGLVFFLFTEMLQICCYNIPIVNKEVAEKLGRAVWMKWLPKQDWRKGTKFKLTDTEFEEVSKDIKKAIEVKLHRLRRQREEAKKMERKSAYRDDASKRKSIIMRTRHDLRRTFASVTESIANFRRMSGTAETEFMRSAVVAARRHSAGHEVEDTVEHVEVTPVIKEWHKTCMQLLDATEREDSYLRMEYRSFLRRQWHARRLRLIRERVKQLRFQLLKILMSAKQLCGCAFVTFTNGEDRDFFLRSEPPRWYEFRRMIAGYSHFTFGRPPFAAVTLKCEPAPHPDDINWVNLEVNMLRRVVRFYGLTIILIVVMITLAAPRTLVQASQVIASAIRVTPGAKGAQTPEETEDWAVKSAAEWLYNSYEYMLSRLSSVAALTINSLILPQLIEWVAEAELSKKKSTKQLRELRLNFNFMVFNLVPLQMLHLWSLEDFKNLALSMSKKPNWITDNLDTIGDKMSPAYGVFVLHYLFNATFISGSIGVLSKHRQRIFRKISLAFFAVTPRDKLKAFQSELFAWGYWYAWALSLICLSVIMSSVVPGALVASCLLFTTRLHIDRYNLDNGVYALGSESNGALTSTVVNSMRLIFALWWFFMGCFFISYQNKPYAPTWITTFGAYALMVVGALMGMTGYLVDFYTFWFRKMYGDTRRRSSRARLSQRAGQDTSQPQLPGFETLHVFLERIADFLKLSATAIPEQDVEGAEHISWDVKRKTEYLWPDEDVESIIKLLSTADREKIDENSIRPLVSVFGLDLEAVKSLITLDDDDDMCSSSTTSSNSSSLEDSRKGRVVEIEMAQQPSRKEKQRCTL